MYTPEAASEPDIDALYSAFSARDRRFDGVFFVGVTSTGIYCRPICPAKMPRKRNCRFLTSPQVAEREGFRPCLRCRPELAPGSAPVDDAQRIAHLLVRRIEEGHIAHDARIEDIAAQFELSARQLRRIVRAQVGVSPIALMQTRRLLLAKQLLTETTLPVTEVAFASGFSSLRRFNDAFSKQYRMPPSRLRERVRRGAWDTGGKTSTLHLAYRPPYDWEGVLDFLRVRALVGAEWVTEDAYARTVRLGDCTGWIRVRHADNTHALCVEFTHTLSPMLPALLGRLRNLFDLDARPDVIDDCLRRDPLLRAQVNRAAGLRVPGAFDGFELAVRAILGQQVTVKAATTLAGRFVQTFGERIETPFAALERLTPTSARVARATQDRVASLGIVGARARSILALAKLCTQDANEPAGVLCLDAVSQPEVVMARLMDVPGIGAWTAHYIAMRALRWPDAFPKEDIAVRKRLGGVTAAQAEAMSQRWRPWRSYAVLHVWRLPVGK